MENSQKKPEDIITELQEEIDKHDYKIKQEKERTQKRREEIKSDIGVDEIKRIDDEISDLVNKSGRIKDSIIDVFYKGVWASMPRKTTYINEDITIRDKNIFRYSKSNDAKFRLVKNNKLSIIQETEENRASDVRKAFQEIEKMEEINGNENLISTVSIESTDFSEYDDSYIRNRSDPVNILAYGPKFRSKIVMVNESEIDEKSDIISKRSRTSYYFKFNDIEYKSRIKHDNVILTSKYKEEIIELMKDVKQMLEEEIERRKKIEENLNDIFKKQLMVADL